MTSDSPLQIHCKYHPLFCYTTNDPALYYQPHASLKAKYHSIKLADGSQESSAEAPNNAKTADLHTQTHTQRHAHKSSGLCRNFLVNVGRYLFLFAFHASVNFRTQ